MDDSGPVRDAARFSPDSRRIALAHRDGDVLVYDLATGQPSRRWRVPEPGVWPSGSMGPRSRSSRMRKHRPAGFWRRRPARLVRSIPLPGERSRCPGAPTARRWRRRARICKIYLWDAATGTRKAILAGHTSGGCGLPSTPAGTLLASNGWESRLWLWDPVLGRPWLNLTGGSNP